MQPLERLSEELVAVERWESEEFQATGPADSPWGHEHGP